VRFRALPAPIRASLAGLGSGCWHLALVRKAAPPSVRWSPRKTRSASRSCGSSAARTASDGGAAHQQAQAVASDERQAQADESQEAPAQAVQRDEEPVARAVAAPINAVVVADVAPVAAVAFVPPAPPAPQEERYPDVDAELLGEEIRRERTQIDGFDARATAVCDLLAEAERKLMEAERMEAALLADDDDGGADQ